MARLKPCPFCGGESITRVRSYGASMQKTTLLCRVGCPRCEVYRDIAIELCDTSFDKMRKVMDEAIEAWNERTG